MSIAHHLHLATPESPNEIAGRASSILGELTRPGGLTTADGLLGDGVRTDRGLWVGVAAPEPERWDPVLDRLGVAASVKVSFRPDREQDLGRQDDDMITLVGALLARLDCDAVLRYHYEIVLMLRRDGELVLDDYQSRWTPERLACVKQPFTWGYHRL
ncbi:SitI3 family protein (plasmid) [Kitasatospora sp. NBC_00070]|uniref:SitI3 family protein n=1 Tax=Kitasatospora sp. NBC_00070 TaxID=2975962 RepID=UPI003247418F